MNKFGFWKKFGKVDIVNLQARELPNLYLEEIKWELTIRNKVEFCDLLNDFLIKNNYF